MKHYSVTEVAVLFGVTVSTVHYWRYTSKMNFERVGYVWITDQEQVDRVRKQREEK